jgi:hypothetical protein
MVVSKVEFNDAMQQINASYAKHIARIEALEAQVAELLKEKTQTKAPAKATAKEAA